MPYNNEPIGKRRNGNVNLGVYCTSDGKTLVFSSPTGNHVRVTNWDKTDSTHTAIIERANRSIWDCTPVELSREEMRIVLQTADKITDKDGNTLCSHCADKHGYDECMPHNVLDSPIPLMYHNRSVECIHCPGREAYIERDRGYVRH